MFFPFILFMFMLVKIGRLFKRRNMNKRLPPGPWKLPFLGNMHQFLASLPHQCLRDLSKRYGPIMHLQLGELSIIVISSPETAKEVMKIHDTNFSSRPFSLAANILLYNVTDAGFAPYGEYWKQLRRICMVELLSLKRVHTFRSIREDEATNLTRAISLYAGSEVNLSKLLFYSVYNIMSRAAFGKKGKHRERFMKIAEKVSEKTGGFSVVDWFPSLMLLHVISGVRFELQRIHQEADKVLESIINEHKAVKATTTCEEDEDFVNVLLNLQDRVDLGFRLTTDNIKAVIQDCLLGGVETSSTILEWAMSEMMKNPGVLHNAQAEVRKVFGKGGKVNEKDLNQLTYLKQVIQETLRLHPPLPLLLPRESREKCEIDGYEIPAKSQVLINAWAIGRDPAYWNESEAFDPDRFADSSIDYHAANFEYIPFGAGRRVCPGMSFGAVIVELLLAHLLYDFDWELPSGKKHEDLDMDEAFGSAVRRKKDLFLIPTQHCTLSLK